MFGIADRYELEQDLRVYVTAIGRVLNSDILPFDHRLPVAEIEAAVADYERQSNGLSDFSVVKAELENLQRHLAQFYERIESGDVAESHEVINRKITELSRILVPLNYAQGRRFDHDPALPLGTVPMLEDAGKLQSCAAEFPERLPFLQAGLIRNANRLAAALYDAAALVRGSR